MELSHRSSHAYYCRNTHGKSHASSAQITSTQQHDYHCDTTDTIVATRAQRHHGSQAGNNLQAGETVDDPQEEALAIAAPQQPIMAAPPPVNPAPPAPAFALGPGRDNAVLDWSTPADTKLYYKVIAALDNKFNGTLEKFIAFLASITSRARQFGWYSILTIPVAMDTRELLSDYGRISMAEINSHATTYTGTQTRAAQNSKMLYHFLMNSVTTEFTTKLVLYQEEYIMNGAPIGACLFKKIIQLTYVDTMATTSHIHETLMDMHLKLPTFQHNNGKFNNWTHIEVGKLASRGQEANDLLTYLWRSYQVVADKKFVSYIK